MNPLKNDRDFIVAQIENDLADAVKPLNDRHKNRILESMSYSLCAGGKRLRPLFIHMMGEAFRADVVDVKALSCAIEMIHTYSLIHDDLPAMDNDDLRRGKPTNHIRFDEATAILAGDALLNLAYETLFKRGMTIQDPHQMARFSKASGYLAEASGIHGMITGQVADIANEGELVSEEELDYINRHKTGALLKAAFMCGAIAGDASEDDLRIIEAAADDFGRAFQIADDLLDLISDTQTLGKPVGSDLKNDKTTYPMLMGFDAAAKEVERLSHRAIERLSSLDRDLTSVEKVILSLVDRKF